MPSPIIESTEIVNAERKGFSLHGIRVAYRIIQNDKRLSACDKLVLLTFATYVDQDFIAWPSWRTVCHEVNIGPSTLKKSLERLKAFSHLKPIGKRGLCIAYEFVKPLANHCPEESTVQREALSREKRGTVQREAEVLSREKRINNISISDQSKPSAQVDEFPSVQVSKCPR